MRYRGRRSSRRYGRRGYVTRSRRSRRSRSRRLGPSYTVSRGGIRL